MWVKAQNAPDIPSQPRSVYPDWIGWPEFLGTGNRVGRLGDYLPYAEAAEVTRQAGITSKEGFRNPSAAR
jgi:hypothetical protein